MTKGKGIPNQIDSTPELYNGIKYMICVMLADSIDMAPKKSILIKVGMKLVHLDAYAGGSDPEEFEVFIAGILRWFKMSSQLGLTSMEMQVSYLGTHLSNKAQEWFYRNIE